MQQSENVHGPSAPVIVEVLNVLLVVVRLALVVLERAYIHVPQVVLERAYIHGPHEPYEQGSWPANETRSSAELDTCLWFCGS